MSTIDMTEGLAKGSLGSEITGGQIADRLDNIVIIENRIINDSSFLLGFPKSGDIAYRLLVNKSCNLSIEPGRQGLLQRMTIILQQSSDGNCDVDFGTSVNWQGRQPFIDTRAGSVTIVEILFDGMDNYYGRLIYG